MKEYWVNVYKDEGLGAVKNITLKDAVYSSSDGIRDRAIYRLHVKMKSKRGLTRAYPFKWIGGRVRRKVDVREYGNIHEKWLDW